jgi:hypothetical protein
MPFFALRWPTWLIWAIGPSSLIALFANSSGGSTCPWQALSVPQCDCGPRTIIDYTFSGVNDETLRLSPKEAMQFGRALHDRLLCQIRFAPPQHGPIYMLSKVNLSV